MVPVVERLAKVVENVNKGGLWHTQIAGLTHPLLFLTSLAKPLLPNNPALIPNPAGTGEP